MSRTYGDRSGNGDKQPGLKQKVKSLERENARLRKDLNKALQTIQQLQNGYTEGETRRVKQLPEAQPSVLCSKCKSNDIGEMELGLRSFTVRFWICRSCGARGRQRD